MSIATSQAYWAELGKTLRMYQSTLTDVEI